MSGVLDIGVYNSYGYATRTTIIIIMQVVSRLSLVNTRFIQKIYHTYITKVYAMSSKTN